MVSKVTEYLVLGFFIIISVILLYLIYLGIINSQEKVSGQIYNEEYVKECNCVEVVSNIEGNIVLRIICNEARDFKALWVDYEYVHNETLYRNNILEIFHNSSFSEPPFFKYNDCE
jgi:hypothetical protein